MKKLLTILFVITLFTACSTGERIGGEECAIYDSGTYPQQGRKTFCAVEPNENDTKICKQWKSVQYPSGTLKTYCAD